MNAAFVSMDTPCTGGLLSSVPVLFTILELSVRNHYLFVLARGLLILCSTLLSADLLFCHIDFLDFFCYFRIFFITA